MSTRYEVDPAGTPLGRTVWRVTRRWRWFRPIDSYEAIGTLCD